MRVNQLKRPVVIHPKVNLHAYDEDAAKLLLLDAEAVPKPRRAERSAFSAFHA